MSEIELTTKHSGALSDHCITVVLRRTGNPTSSNVHPNGRSEAKEPHNGLTR